MNWKLIFSLSMFGIAMAVAGLFGLTRHVEPLLWLAIFIFYAGWIAKHVPSKLFLHGFLVSVVNGVWIAIIHAAFHSTYLENNPEMLEDYQKFSQYMNPQTMMLIIGPCIGAITGVVAGLLAMIAGRILKVKPV
jgi:small-conductance mechanosensitive channel